MKCKLDIMLKNYLRQTHGCSSDAIEVWDVCLKEDKINGTMVMFKSQSSSYAGHYGGVTLDYLKQVQPAVWGNIEV